jgi:hypothetical protein
MAVQLETNVQRWNGAAADDKPATATEGSTFHAVDTGEEYVYHNGMWALDLRKINAIKMAARKEIDMYGKVGAQSLSDGSTGPVRLDSRGNLVVAQGGKYRDAAEAGRLYVACNQAAVALTAAMATTYTGLVLSNPSTSAKNFVLCGCGYATTIAVPTATAIGLMTGVNAGDAAAAITPRNRLIGGAASVAVVDNGCTLVGTPVLEQVFGTAWTEATTAGTVGPKNWIDLEGSLVVPPGAYAAFYSTAANSAAFLCWFMWEEVAA